jgi:hypothetical protein
MNFGKLYKSLCPPAHFYVVISVILGGLILVQNLFNGDASELCIGSYTCDISHVAIFFMVKILYVVFWAWVLNLLCNNGLKSLSWFLVLVPVVLFALLLGIFIYEDIEGKNKNEKNEKNKQHN